MPMGLMMLWWLLFLPSGQNWIGVVVDEGFVHHGAQRVLAGEVPHRDFFFLWTPGILWLHALAQTLTGEFLYTGRLLVVGQGLVLLWLQLRMARDLGLGGAARILLWILVAVWGVSAWNMPYASWNAILCAWAAAHLLPRKPLVAGALLALSFWFKQNVGLYAMAAVGAWGLWKSSPVARRALVTAAAGVGGGWALFALLAGGGAALQAWRQWFVFPLTYREVMAHPLPTREMLLAFGVALVALGGEARRSRRLLFFPVAAALFYAFSRSWGFASATESFFFLAVLLAFPLFLAARRKELAGIRAETWLVLGVTAACGLQLYPRFDRAHFVFSFSVAVVPFVAALARLPRVWAAAWTLVILAGGAQENAAALRAAWGGERIFGLGARGDAAAYLGEMREVIDWLRRERGLKEGSPLVQIPVTTLFWPVSGFKNPTPHVQFFPQYVEAFGGRQDQVLGEAERNGAKLVVLDRWAETERWAPELYFSLITGWRETKRFPSHFSVWERP
ncbi:MAG: hypothetical protein HUU37_01320 [Bdellovibrionales bacterium]|nr:hypothetical protein [Bdellovibrionales bacterium]